MNDSINGLSESATFCKANDDKRPSLVGLPDGTTQQVCPTDGSGVTNGVTDAAPQGWFVRVVFDELLDPSIEDLTEILDDDGMPTGTYSGSIARTHPFKLQCAGISGAMVDVPYDGYYSASGNALTWPLGPSLVIKPNIPASVPSNAKCTVTLNENILDKNDGVQVPTDQRGPYDFSIGKIRIASLSPSDGDELDPKDAGVDIVFNDLVDFTSSDGSEFVFTPADKAENVYVQLIGANGSFAPGPENMGGVPTVGGRPVGANEAFVGADFYASTDYTFQIPAGSKFTDLCGVTTTFGAPSKDDSTEVSFSTTALKFSGLTPVDGTMAAVPGSLIRLQFNQYMDPTTVTGWSLKEGSTDVTASAVLVNNASDPSRFDIRYPYKLNTDYTFDLPASNVRECPGAEIGACATDGMSIAIPAQHTTFHTISTMAPTATSPATGASITKLTTTDDAFPIVVAFNIRLNPTQALVQDTNFTITPNVPGITVVGSGTSLAFIAADPWAAGDYTFTLKKDSVIVDASGTAMYTVPSDLVIQFHVDDPEPAPVCLP